MILIAHVFMKLRTQNKLVRTMPKNSRFKRSFKKQHGKCDQTLLKYQWQLLYQIYSSLLRQLSYKKSLLVICKISSLFINTLSDDNKYSLFNRDNLTQPIQMQLSQKQKTFSDFLTGFLKSSLNFEHFLKKDDPHCWCICNLRTGKNLVRWMTKKSPFKRSFEKQHGKSAQTLLKCEGQHLYHI